MKKTKRQKAFEWKHLMSRPNNPHLNNIYGKRFDKLFKGRKFDIISYRKEVNRLIWLADYGTGFPEGRRGENQYIHSKGVGFNYRDMTFKMLIQSGVKAA